MKVLRLGLFFLVASTAFTGCGGGGGNLTPPSATNAPSTSAPTSTPAPTATPTVTPTATPMTTVASTVSLNNGASLNNAPVSMPVPAPTGFAQTLSLPIVNAAAGTTVATTAGAAPPTGIATLGLRPTRFFGGRAPDAGTFNTIFYNSVMPSANVTVAGNLSFTQSFPNGGLTPGTSYYLGFYDTTKASPAWQTISGPVTASGNNLTFAGTTSSITFVAGKLYGFATFSGVTPAATPPPAPQTLLYYGNGNGLTISDAAGNVVNTLAIPSQTFDLDDAGNVYANDPHHGGTSPGVGGTKQFAKFPAGSATASAIFTPSLTTNVFVSVSGAGEAIAVHNVGTNNVLTTDVWDPNTSGAPSRVINTNVATGVISFVLTHDGTIYLPDTAASGAPQFDIFPPGSTTASKIIPETILPASQYKNFSPNYSAVGADGTLYVTEYSFQQPDPNAGLYIYPTTGPERFIPVATDANGPGPQGVDVDASNNIYVVNNNTAVLTSTTCQGDSLQSMSVFDQKGNVLRTVKGAFTGFPLTVAGDGSAFVSSFKAQLQSSCAVTGVNGIFAIAPGSSTVSQISTVGSSQIVLFDGTHKTEPFARSSHAVFGGGRGGSLGRFRDLR